jgi:hypothetical protein
LAFAAAVLRSREIQAFAQDPQQHLAFGDGYMMRLAIDSQVEFRHRQYLAVYFRAKHRMVAGSVS